MNVYIEANKVSSSVSCEVVLLPFKSMVGSSLLVTQDRLLFSMTKL